MEAGNRLLLPWRHGVSPAPVGFHHYILSASMAQQRGLEPPSRMNFPTTRFPGGPTTSYRTAADCPAEPFHTVSSPPTAQKAGIPGNTLRIFFGGRSGIRTHRPCFRSSVFGTDWLPLPHPAVWRRGRESNPQAPFTGTRRISNPLPYHWAHLSILITNSIVI